MAIIWLAMPVLELVVQDVTVPASGIVYVLPALTTAGAMSSCALHCPDGAGLSRPIVMEAEAGPAPASAARTAIPHTARACLARLAKDPQQEQEEVDEVKIEGERAHDRRASLGLAAEALLRDLGELLHVVRGQRGEDRDAGVRGDPVERRVGPENVDDGRQDQSDQRHEGD